MLSKMKMKQSFRTTVLVSEVNVGRRELRLSLEEDLIDGLFDGARQGLGLRFFLFFSTSSEFLLSSLAASLSDRFSCHSPFVLSIMDKRNLRSSIAV